MTKKMTAANLFFKREIRDPIYGYICLTNYECDILDSEIFQRLDKILQMPTAQFVYPSAKHTRKTHSLGTMHLSSKAILNILFRQSIEKREKTSSICWGEPVVLKGKNVGLQSFDQKLREEWWNSKEEEQIIQCLRLAGMLHDIGHAPLSHLFEDVCRNEKIKFKFKGKSKIFDHELMSIKIIEEKEKELGFKSPFKAEDVTQILKEGKGGRGRKGSPTFLHDLISGAYDCDKLDYLARDAYATGAIEFGAIDFMRIINSMRVSSKETLVISASALDALMKSFDAVQYMYTTVYYHKTVRGFDFMIAEALGKIPEFLQEIVSDIDKFLSVDDYCFLTSAREYAKKENAHEALTLLDDIRYRRKKYKDIFSHRISIDYMVKDTIKRQLRKIKKALQKEAKNLEIVIDYRPGIRPVGIDIEDIPGWLDSKTIYDPIDGTCKNLKDICQAFHRRLIQYVILFRVYANRKQLSDSSKKIYETERRRIVELAKNMLKKLDDEYFSFRVK
jgi:HD superfamily phosphohydrolase